MHLATFQGMILPEEGEEDNRKGVAKFTLKVIINTW